MSNDEHDTVKAAYVALARGDLDTFLAAFSDEVSWSEAAGLATGGEYHGREAAVAGALQPFVASFAELAVTPHTYVHEKSRVVVLGRYVGVTKRTNEAIDVPFVHVWEFSEAQVRRFTQVTDTALLNRAIAAPQGPYSWVPRGSTRRRRGNDGTAGSRPVPSA